MDGSTFFIGVVDEVDEMCWTECVIGLSAFHRHAQYENIKEAYIKLF